MAKLSKMYVVKDFNKQLYAIPASTISIPCIWDPNPYYALVFQSKWEAKDFIKRITGTFQIEKIYTNE